MTKLNANFYAKLNISNIQFRAIPLDRFLDMCTSKFRMYEEKRSVRQQSLLSFRYKNLTIFSICKLNFSIILCKREREQLTPKTMGKSRIELFEERCGKI